MTSAVCVYANRAPGWRRLAHLRGHKDARGCTRMHAVHAGACVSLSFETPAALLHAAAESVPLVAEYHAIGGDFLEPEARRHVLALVQQPVVDADQTIRSIA